MKEQHFTLKISISTLLTEVLTLCHMILFLVARPYIYSLIKVFFSYHHLSALQCGDNFVGHYFLVTPWRERDSEILKDFSL